MQLFEVVGDALRGLLPPELGPVRAKSHRFGVKAWFGPETPTRAHYEAQVIGARHVTEATVLAVELGFHAEHPKEAENEALVALVLAQEATWRKVLGREVVVGPFLGRDSWRRVSETWADPDLGDPDLGFELASRLTDYIVALEPALRGGQ